MGKKQGTTIGATPWGAAWWAQWVPWQGTLVWKKGGQYAAQGAVAALSIEDDGQVQATVLERDGSRCQQRLRLTPWTESQRAAWRIHCKAQPHAVAQLQRPHLPEAWWAEDLPLAPLWAQDPADWAMACSCTKRRQPCHHIVAVLHLLAQRIDQDPSSLFELRGVSVAEWGTGIARPQTLDSLPSLQDWAATAGYARLHQRALLGAIDYAPIDNRAAQWATLFEAKPAFYGGDLWGALQRDLGKAQRWLRQQAWAADSAATYHQQLRQTKDLALVVGLDGQPVQVLALQGEAHVPLFPSDRVLEGLVGVLATLPLDRLEQYPDALVGLHAVFRLAQKLVAERAVLPQLMQTPKGIIVQWLPVSQWHSALPPILSQLTKACPADMLVLDAEPLQRFLPLRQIEVLIGLFVGYFLRQATERTEQVPTANHLLEYWWSSGLPLATTTPQAQLLPQQFKRWLEPLYVQHHQYAPVLWVKEQQDEQEGTWSFVVRVQVENRANPQTARLDWTQFLQLKTLAPHHVPVLQTLQRLGAYYSDLEVLYAKKETEMGPYTLQEFEHLFFEVLPVLKLLGVAVILPQSLQRLTRPRLCLEVDTKDKTSKPASFMSLKKLLQVQWKVAVGEQLIEAVELLKLFKKGKGLVRREGRYLYLREAELERILEELESPPPAAAHELIHAALSEHHPDYPIRVHPRVGAYLEALRQRPVVAPPRQLQATLRPYQQVGYAWMYNNAQLGLGALIADDMGLGKTLQVITLLLKFKEEGQLEGEQVLVVVPTSLLTNWQKELAKFAPLLQVGVYHGAKRQLQDEADVLLTTYGVARMDASRLSQEAWFALVIDEAQAIKNSHSAQTEALKSIPAHLRIAMSGTPVENRLGEYWSIMDFVYPNYLGTLSDFNDRFAIPIERDQDQQALDAFRQITAPFILRRLKSDASIIQDLPDKVEQDWSAPLQPLQQELYQKIVDDTWKELHRQRKKPKARQILLLQLMSGLKQVCNHPYQYLGSGGRSPAFSGKGQVLMDLLERIEAQGEKVLIFTQYRKMGRLISDWIAERWGAPPLYLHGGCSRPQRDVMVEAFQNDPQQRIFLLSLKAAGTGLNLTAANHVIHYDLWWNPAVEAQATDRAYRIGQHKNVQVYRLMTAGTLEERINAMIQSKKALADQTVVLGEQWLGHLDDEELRALVDLGEW